MWIVPFTPCICSPERAEESSRTSSSACAPSAPSKSRNTPSASSPSASPASQSGTTCRHSAPTIQTAPNASRGCESIEPTSLSRAVSRAKTLARRAVAKDYPARALASGGNLPESFARFDRDSSSWRIPQCLFQGDWSAFLGTWPRAGMMRSGECWRLPMLERATFASEFGLPLLCGTATSNCCARGGAFVSATPTAVELMRTREMFPTPVAGAGNFNAAGASSKSGDGLWTALQKRAGITPPRASRRPARTTDCREGANPK